MNRKVLTVVIGLTLALALTGCFRVNNQEIYTTPENEVEGIIDVYMRLREREVQPFIAE